MAPARLRCSSAPSVAQRPGGEAESARHEGGHQPHEGERGQPGGGSQEAEDDRVSGPVTERLGRMRRLGGERADPEVVDDVHPPDVRGRVDAERERGGPPRERSQVEGSDQADRCDDGEQEVREPSPFAHLSHVWMMTFEK